MSSAGNCYFFLFSMIIAYCLGSTQTLVRMSTRNILGGKGGRYVRLTTYHDTVLLPRNLGVLTLILLTWTIWRAPTNTSKWRMGFNSAFKGLTSQTPLGLHGLLWRAFTAYSLTAYQQRCTVHKDCTVRKEISRGNDMKFFIDSSLQNTCPLPLYAACPVQGQLYLAITILYISFLSFFLSMFLCFFLFFLFSFFLY